MHKVVKVKKEKALKTPDVKVHKLKSLMGESNRGILAKKNIALEAAAT